MGNLPTNFVITVWRSEKAARMGLIDEGTSSSQYKAFQVDSDGKVENSGQANNNYGYWTHEKYWYRIEANEPVKEFYIDWDDGEDNDPNGKANYTVIKNDVPSFVGITSHVYTGGASKSGAMFMPRIRVKSVDGYMSKFYVSKYANDDDEIVGIEVLQGDTDLPQLRNDKYIAERDSNTELIPTFIPNPKPPIAVLKSDKKRVFAGINNNYLKGADASNSSADGSTVNLVEAHSGSPVRTGVTLRVTYTTTGNNDSIDAGRGDITVTDMSESTTNTLTNVVSILKVELLNLLEDTVAWNGSSPSTTKLFPGEKMCLVAGAYDATKEQTIAEVSLGNPIVEIDNPRYTVTHDLTESYTRTQAQTISDYYIADGSRHLNFGYSASDLVQHSVNDNENPSPSDVFNDAETVLEHTSGIKRSSYSFDLHHNVVDSDFRWLPKQLLARGQIKCGNLAGTTARQHMQYSYLEHWVNSGHAKNYEADMSVASYNWTDDMISSGVIAFKGLDDTDRWVDLEGHNKKAGDASNYLIKGIPGATSSNVRLFANSSTTTLGDSDNTAILVCARDSKWTKQFWKQLFNNATVARGHADYAIPGSSLNTEGVGTAGVGHMNIRVEAFYTAHEHGSSDFAAWKPLKMLNKTKHPDYDDSTWYTDGIFEWEEPDDWALVDVGGIKDKYFPRGDYYSSSDATSWAFSTHDILNNAANVDFFEDEDVWDSTNKKYGIMFLIKTDGGATSKADSYAYTSILNTWPCSNTHSNIIDLIDPMCVSLNSFAITQSINFTHKGKYQTVEDRLGKAEIRKIGSNGGNIKFGGIDLNDTSRAKFYEFQSKATPVYLDVTHTNGDISRFFGVITSMSEDHPTGKLKPKFGLDMAVSHMITIDSSGNMLSDGYISLGGQIDEPKYI
jgi:hypothetical protein